MAYVQLIDTEYVFLHSDIDKNVDPNSIDPHIIVAQDTEIQQILGQNLYQFIMDSVANGSITDPNKSMYNTLLMNYIKPALCHWTVWFALPFIQYHLTNKSILSKTTDNATTTGLDVLQYLRNNVKHYCDFYNQRIREQIINNPSDYPEYYLSTGIDRIRPKRTTYFSGWSGNELPKKNAASGAGRGDPDCAGCDPQGFILNW